MARLPWLLQIEPKSEPASARFVFILSMFNVSDLIVYGEALHYSHFLASLVYATAYSIAALMLASIIFAERELA